MARNEIGQNIKEIRKQKGLTQKELAEKCGFATGTIQQYELGKREPRYNNVEKIAKALNVSKSEIIGLAYIDLDSLQKKMVDRLPLTQIEKSLDLLNKSGKQVAVERVEELTHIEKYTRKETEEE